MHHSITNLTLLCKFTTTLSRIHQSFCNVCNIATIKVYIYKLKCHQSQYSLSSMLNPIITTSHYSFTVLPSGWLAIHYNIVDLIN